MDTCFKNSLVVLQFSFFASPQVKNDCGLVTQCTLSSVGEKATAIDNGCKGDYIYYYFSVREKQIKIICLLSLLVVLFCEKQTETLSYLQ